MNVLGIDVGGTSIKGAIVNSNGELITEKFVLPIDKNDDQDVCIDKLIKLIKTFLKESKMEIDGIGMGIPGVIDSKNGIVSYSNNLKWVELPIVEKMTKAFNKPVKITNDANAAALGENRFGSGRQYKDMIMITLGTGVGGGIICDGHLIEGHNGKGAELGHSLLILDGLPCGCGRRGCFEQYASATALIRQTKEALAIHPESMLANLTPIDGRSAFIAAKAGDETANAVVDQYVKYLSEGLLNYCNVFRPECIVLSGGISKEGDYLNDKIKKYLKDREYGYPRSPEVEIKEAELGYHSGIIGAASLLLK